MEGHDLEDDDRERFQSSAWGVEDAEERTSPRFALGTREIVPLSVTTEHPHRDVPHEDVAKIVHDFKGPLGTIGLEVELLGQSLAAGTAVDATRISERITRNVAFLDRLVMDLLDMCTLEAGRFELRRARTELRTLLEQVIVRVVPTRDRERVYLDAREAVFVDIDDLRIERVVANLLHNALAYAPAGTGIIIKLEREPHVARISVIDAGYGLTAAASRSVTGLGLALSTQILEAHGGTIGVDSIRGEGTRFYFELPTPS